MSHTTLLSRIPLFQGLPQDQLDTLSEPAREETFPEDANVVEIGDAGRALFVILEGEVQVLYPARNADFELARLGPGDFFGEMALLNDQPRSATVKTASTTRLLVLDKEDFRTILFESPTVAVRLLETLSLRIRNVDEKVSALSDEAMQDALTGLLNRRAFHERLDQEVHRHRRYGDGFTLVVLDVDGLKAVNDSFGYEVGDRVLTWIGRLLTQHTRAADVPFRIGGEEFALLAPAAEGEIGQIVAERLVRMVEEARPPVDFNLRVTISAGYGSCPDHGSQSSELFAVADAALFQAKSNGRNRVCSPDEVSASPSPAS